MKIGDLFVKLGLKKDQFSKGMKEADKETKTFAGAMKSMSAIGAAAWAAVSAAVVKFATDAVKMTQKWGDEWNNTMEGVKAAYGTFVRQLSSGAGWDNLFQNMAEAYRRGKEVAAVLDEIFERKISFSYQEASTEKEVEEWRAIMNDQSKSDKERKEAANKIIELEQKLGDVKKGIWADEAAARREQFKIASGLENDDDINFLVQEYNKNREVINQAREYLRLKKEYSSSTGGNDFFTRTAGAGRSNKVDPRLAKLESETPQYIKNIAELTKGYDKANDELVQGMAEAEVAAIRVDTQVLQAQRRAKQTLGSLNAKKGGGKAGKTEEELQMEQAQRIQQRAEESAKSELQLLNEKYMQERALLQAFGMDVTALTAEYEKNVSKLLDVPLQKMEELDDLVVDLDIEIDDDPVEEFIKEYEDGLQRMQDLLSEIRDAAIAGLSDAIQELADQFMGLSEINPGKVVQALLTPLADLAIKEGEILIAQGIGVEACKEALESLNGYAAIMAGTAILAIGAAAKSGLKALANSGARSTTTTSYGGGASANNLQTIQTEMTVYVTGRISGSDILLSGKKTQDNYNR